VGSVSVPSTVVAVLVGVEPAPAAIAGAGILRAEDAAMPRIAVGNVLAGDLIIAVVLADGSGCKRLFKASSRSVVMP
jgi:hypothetical protein